MCIRDRSNTDAGEHDEPALDESDDESALDESDDESGAATDDEVDPIIAKLRAAMAGTPGSDESDTPESPLDDRHDIEPAPPVDEVEEPPAPMAVAAPEPLPPRTLQPPSIQIRPGSADPTPDEPTGPGRKMLLAVAVVVLAVGAIAGSVIARAVDPFGSESAAADQSVTTTTEATDPSDPEDASTPPPVSDGCPDLELPGPDADADGCPDPISLDGRVATVGDVAVELGEDGDQVVVADADCDGTATPVLLRPSTGEVFDFPGWSLDEAIEISSTAVIDGATSIETTDGPCPDVIVIDGAGDRVVVAP